MRTLWRLKAYPLRYKWRLAIAYLCATVTTASFLVFPPLFGTAVDEVLDGGMRSQQLQLAGIIVLVFVVRGVFGFGQNSLSESVSQRAAFDLRNDFFKSLLRLSFGFYDRERTGDLMSKATTDVLTVQFMMSTGLSQMLVMVVMLLAIPGIMVAISPLLAFIILLIEGIYLWRATTGLGTLEKMWKRVYDETGDMTAVLQENIAGMKVVKLFGAHEYEEAKFEPRARAVTDYSYTANNFMFTRIGVFIFISTAATGVALWFGGRQVIDGQITAGELVTFLLYLAMSYAPIDFGLRQVAGLTGVISSGNRILGVIDAESPVKEAPDARVMPRARGHVRFESVSLSYDELDEAVHDIDIDVEPGRTVALLGGPGSGKSTLVHLIPRFYDVSSGRVTIDGMDVRDATLSSLRRNVGIVLQDIFVFAGSWRDNIAWGVDEATMEDVVRAARVAQLHEFIQGRPDGYDTLIGEKGADLSGGERQRLAIARTILMDPPILILDDSTSSVDMGTEHLIQKALDEVIGGRTTFVISHRLATVRQADVILVLDKGEIVERGDHDELLALGGLYRKMHDLQLAPTVEEALAKGRGATSGGRAL